MQRINRVGVGVLLGGALLIGASWTAMVGHSQSVVVMGELEGTDWLGPMFPEIIDGTMVVNPNGGGNSKMATYASRIGYTFGRYDRVANEVTFVATQDDHADWPTQGSASADYTLTRPRHYEEWTCSDFASYVSASHGHFAGGVVRLLEASRFRSNTPSEQSLPRRTESLTHIQRLCFDTDPAEGYEYGAVILRYKSRNGGSYGPTDGEYWFTTLPADIEDGTLEQGDGVRAFPPEELSQPTTIWDYVSGGVNALADQLHGDCRSVTTGKLWYLDIYDRPVPADNWTQACEP